MSAAVNALHDELDALMARLDAPAYLERMHLVGRVCADLRIASTVRRHIERRTDTLFVAIADAGAARTCLGDLLGGGTEDHDELCTPMADVAQARDRLAAALDALQTDETITAAIRAYRSW
jgi:hypothetical protein